MPNTVTYGTVYLCHI